jgi:hypothetical protein
VSAGTQTRRRKFVLDSAAPSAEAGEQQPLFSVAVAIAGALRIPVADLAGMPTHRERLSGEWWASWQTFRDGVEKIATQKVEMQQEGEFIRVSILTHGLSDAEGGLSGELRLWDNEILMGWYASTEGAIRDKGTMYFVLHPHGRSMAGRWVGLSNDGKVITGYGSMAKEHDGAETVIDRLKQRLGEVDVT